MPRSGHKDILNKGEHLLVGSFHSVLTRVQAHLRSVSHAAPSESLSQPPILEDASHTLPLLYRHRFTGGPSPFLCERFPGTRDFHGPDQDQPELAILTLQPAVFLISSLNYFFWQTSPQAPCSNPPPCILDHMSLESSDGTHQVLLMTLPLIASPPLTSMALFIWIP